MIKRLFGITLFALAAIGCHQTNKHSIKENLDSIENPKDTVKANVSIPHANVVDSNITFIENTIIFPSRYRIWQDSPPSEILAKGDWKELYLKEGQYTIGKPSYVIENIEEEPCSGLPAEDINSSTHALLYLKIQQIPQGKVDSIAYTEKVILPQKPLVFQHQGKEYKLIASGIEKFYESNDLNIAYTLNLFIDGKYSRTLIHQKEYNDTAPEIQFIGDLDKDGIIDFIFSSPRNYEEERTIIILSSEKQHYEGNRQFDC